MKELENLIKTEQEFIQNISKMIEEHVSETWKEELLFTSKPEGDDKNEK